MEKFPTASLVFILRAAFIGLWRASKINQSNFLEAGITQGQDLIVLWMEAELESRFPDSLSSSYFSPPDFPLALHV
jgi:hypothetical protein